MSNEIIYCFNKPEGNTDELVGQCIYEKCPMFSEEIDTCKLELLKRTHIKQVKPQRTIPTAKEVVQEAVTQVGGARLISSLKQDEKSSKANPICLKGTLVFDPIQKDVDTARGPTSVTSAVIKDDSGEAKISWWGDDGNEIMDYVKGDKLFLEGLYKVDAPYDGKPQVTGGKYYKVAKLN